MPISHLQPHEPASEGDMEILLFKHEKTALVDALRRDLRRQLDAVACRDETQEHNRNARIIRRLLDLINPRKRAIECHRLYDKICEV